MISRFRRASLRLRHARTVCSRQIILANSVAGDIPAVTRAANLLFANLAKSHVYRGALGARLQESIMINAAALTTNVSFVKWEACSRRGGARREVPLPRFITGSEASSDN